MNFEYALQQMREGKKVRFRDDIFKVEDGTLKYRKLDVYWHQFMKFSSLESWIIMSEDWELFTE